MVMTKAGGITLRKTMIEKFGSQEAYAAHMAEVGRKGGKNGRTGGFAANSELARIAGARGGRISKRPPMNRVVLYKDNFGWRFNLESGTTVVIGQHRYLFKSTATRAAISFAKSNKARFVDYE